MYRHGAIMLFSCTTIVQVLDVLKQVDVLGAISQKPTILKSNNALYLESDNNLLAHISTSQTWELTSQSEF